MTFQKLKDELQVMYGGCLYFIDVDKILDAELFIDGKVTTVAKISVKENFTAEQTAALFMAIPPIVTIAILSTIFRTAITVSIPTLPTKKN